MQKISIFSLCFGLLMGTTSKEVKNSEISQDPENIITNEIVKTYFKACLMEESI